MEQPPPNTGISISTYGTGSLPPTASSSLMLPLPFNHWIDVLRGRDNAPQNAEEQPDVNHRGDHELLNIVHKVVHNEVDYLDTLSEARNSRFGGSPLVIINDAVPDHILFWIVKENSSRIIINRSQSIMYKREGHTSDRVIKLIEDNKQTKTIDITLDQALVILRTIKNPRLNFEDHEDVAFLDGPVSADIEDGSTWRLLCQFTGSMVHTMILQDDDSGDPPVPTNGARVTYIHMSPAFLETSGCAPRSAGVYNGITELTFGSKVKLTELEESKKEVLKAFEDSRNDLPSEREPPHMADNTIIQQLGRALRCSTTTSTVSEFGVTGTDAANIAQQTRMQFQQEIETIEREVVKAQLLRLMFYVNELQGTGEQVPLLILDDQEDVFDDPAANAGDGNAAADAGDGPGDGAAGDVPGDGAAGDGAGDGAGAADAGDGPAAGNEDEGQEKPPDLDNDDQPENNQKVGDIPGGPSPKRRKLDI